MLQKYKVILITGDMNYCTMNYGDFKVNKYALNK